MSEIDPTTLRKMTESAETLGRQSRQERLLRMHPELAHAAIVTTILTAKPNTPPVKINVSLKERNLFPSGIVNMPYSEQSDPSMFLPITMGTDSFTDAIDAYGAMVDHSTSGDPIDLSVYTATDHTLDATRRYVAAQEKAAHSALLQSENPTLRSDATYRSYIEDELGDSAYLTREDEEASRFRRLLGFKKTRVSTTDMVDNLRRDSPNKLEEVAIRLSEARTWHDMYIADSATTMGFDALCAVHAHLNNALQGKSREYAKLEQSLPILSSLVLHRHESTESNGYNINEVDRLLLTMNDTFNGQVNTGNLSDRLRTYVDYVRTRIVGAIALRSRASTPLYGEGLPAILTYVPSNFTMFDAITPEREAIELAPAPAKEPATPEQIAAERTRRLQERREQQRLEQEARDAANERDAPQLEAISNLINTYAAVLKPFRSSSKQLRNLGIVGGKSLEFTIRKNAHASTEVDGLTDTLRTYEGMASLLGEHDDGTSDVIRRFAKLDALADAYTQRIAELHLEGTNKPALLEHTIPTELTWLRDNWDLLEASIAQSAHQEHTDSQHLERLHELILQLTTTETESEVEDTPTNERIVESAIDEADLEMPTESPVPEITVTDNESDTFKPDLHESEIQLDWEILPPGELERMSHEIVERARSETNNPTIDLKRLKILEKIRQEWGSDNTYYAHGSFGTRGYVSDGEAMEANQYIMLILQEKDAAGKVVGEHAVAESPIAGPHALYVFRQDVSEGLEWRDVMSLPKSVASDLGARGLKHTLPREETNLVEFMERKVAWLLAATADEFHSLEFDGTRGPRMTKRSPKS